MLTPLKHLFYRGARVAGPNATLLRSRWRTQSLLVLCYHGVSLHDEDRWCPLYLRPESFRERLDLVRQAHCNVLPLGEAVERLYEGTLPPRSVVITFDDGFYDFYAKAWPLLREYGYPATVYFTTYYSLYNVPVFDPACWYLLWKACGLRFQWREAGIEPILLDDATCQSVCRQIKEFCAKQHLDGRQKNLLLRELAGRVGVDFDELCARRMLHIMNPAEAAELARGGVDFQLHCHRHRVYRSRERFQRELKDNRNAIESITGQSSNHFCYPGGCRLPEFSDWLAELGILSATTTDPGLATRESGRYALPRLLDTRGINADEFSAWLSGVAHFIPRAHVPAAEGQLVEEEGGHPAAA